MSWSYSENFEDLEPLDCRKRRFQSLNFTFFGTLVQVYCLFLRFLPNLCSKLPDFPALNVLFFFGGGGGQLPMLVPKFLLRLPAGTGEYFNIHYNTCGKNGTKFSLYTY